MCLFTSTCLSINHGVTLFPTSLAFPSSSCTKPYDSDDLTTPPRSPGLEYHFMSIHTIVKKTRTDVYAHDTKPDTNRPAHANKFNLALSSAWVLINALK
jgi:hypothetical protein